MLRYHSGYANLDVAFSSQNFSNGNRLNKLHKP